ncbi:MAG: hypothetical protein LBF78_13985 [Treponema sp.]|jgi:hypothetical protein|nr:hypothetical protein [Treponema sp.]
MADYAAGFELYIGQLGVYMAIKHLIAVSLLSCAVLVWGQTAAEIEGILDTEEITYTQAAYFTLASAPGTPPTSQAGAFVLALERGWLPKNAEPDSSVKLRNLSLLIMKAFDLEGGLMYTLFPGPRYSYREMTRRGFIEGRVYPGFAVSGERFLQILGNVLSHIGDAEPLETEAVRRRLSEDPRDSLRDNAGEYQGLSIGSEAIQEYEGEFEPE